MEPQVDVVIVGGGHNGLTAAAYLAKAGLTVTVLERLSNFGGAAVSEKPSQVLMPSSLGIRTLFLFCQRRSLKILD